jgi:hypothetical protein
MPPRLQSHQPNNVVRKKIRRDSGSVANFARRTRDRGGDCEMETVSNQPKSDWPPELPDPR